MVRACKPTEELVDTKCLKKCEDGKIRNPASNRCITQKAKDTRTQKRADVPAQKRCPKGTRRNKQGVCMPIPRSPSPARLRSPSPEKPRSPSPARLPSPPKYTSTIQFHSKAKQFQELSNFADFSVEYDGKIYPTVEHAYQALKYTCTNKPELVEMVRKLDTPEKAKSAGGKGGMSKQGAVLDIECWNNKKDKIMQDLVKSKIDRHSAIRDILKTAKEQHIFLVHFSRFDMEWGAHVDTDGKIKKGENKLGVLFNEFANKM